MNSYSLSASDMVRQAGEKEGKREGTSDDKNAKRKRRLSAVPGTSEGARCACVSEVVTVATGGVPSGRKRTLAVGSRRRRRTAQAVEERKTRWDGRARDGKLWVVLSVCECSGFSGRSERKKGEQRRRERLLRFPISQHHPSCHRGGLPVTLTMSSDH